MSLPAVRSGSDRPLDQVRLTGLRVRARHGVFEYERRDGQDFVLDLVLHLDVRAAAASDRLQDTVDYGALSLAVVAAVRDDPVNLLETVAGRVAEVCLAQRRVVAVDVVLHKPQAPLAVEFGDVAVAIRRTRGERSSVRRAPARGARPGRRAGPGPGRDSGTRPEVTAPENGEQG